MAVNCAVLCAHGERSLGRRAARCSWWPGCSKGGQSEQGVKFLRAQVPTAVPVRGTPKVASPHFTVPVGSTPMGWFA